MKIRQATAADRRGILNLIRMYPKQLLQIHLPKYPSFFVAVEGRRIVGCCALQVHSRRLAEVRSLAVHPDFKGKKIGTKLVKSCIEKAKKLNAYELLAITGREKMFGKVGFRSFQGERLALFMVLGNGSVNKI